MIPIDKAFELINEAVQQLPTETIRLRRSVGRILNQDVISDVDSPPHDKSVMDGFAIQSDDINSGKTKLEVVETIVAGAWPEKEIRSGQCSRIMTGAPLPVGADAIVMIEQTDFDEEKPNTVTIQLKKIVAGQHMMQKAVTIAKGNLVFKSGHVVRPPDVGLLAETGAFQVAVGGVPTIAFLPTGDELVDCSETPGPAQIRNSNGPMLLAMAEGMGLRAKNLGVGRDEPVQLTQMIQQGLEYDLFILSGGVSAGKLDLVPEILAEQGVMQVFHKVAIKPGKPIWFGVKVHSSGRRTYVFGLPGNPVSSMVGFHVFVRAAIRKMMGSSTLHPPTMKAELATEFETRGDRPTYWPGRWVNNDSATRTIEPLVWKGSSDLLALGLAEVLVFFPSSPNRYAPGEIMNIVSLI